MRYRLVILLAAATLLLLGTSALAQDMEAKCVELGSQCTCSETLNVFANLPANPAGPSWNPPNSITKPCGDNCSMLPQCNGDKLYMGTNYQTDSSMVRASNLALFPGGADPWVYKGGVGGIHHFILDQWQNVANETICQRAYRAYNASIPTSIIDPQRLKIEAIHLDVGTEFPGRMDHQLPESGGGGVSSVGFVTFGVYFADHAATHPDLAKCKQGWCRFEMCIDMSGSTLRMRSRVKHLVDGTESPVQSQLGSGPSTIVAEGGVSFYASGLDSAGRHYLSHVMLARKPYDPSFWIGPAYELEGGGGAPPTITAPVLLNQ